MKLTVPAIMLLFASAIFGQAIAVTPEAADLCPCSTQALQITLYNDAGSQRTYQLSTSGSAGNWATLTERAISLRAGEARTTYAYATVPCNAPPGTEDFEIRTNYDGRTESKKISLQVLDCYKLDVKPAEQGIRGCRGDVLSGNVSVVNKGKYKETVLIDTGTAAASANPFAVIIQPQEEKTIEVLLNTTAAEPQAYPVSLSISSSRSPATTSARLTYSILTCYNVSVFAPAAMDACSGEPERLPVESSNLGIFNETGTIVIFEDGQLLYNSTVLMGPGERRTDGFNITAPNKPKETVTIKLQTPHAQDETITDVKILDCDAFSAILTDNFELICPCQSGTATLRITNLGKREQSFSITATGTANLTEELSLQSYDKKDVTLPILVQCETNPPNKAKVTVNNSKYTQELADEAYIPPFSTCYNASVNISPATMTLPREKGEVLNVSIRNSGLTNQTFYLETFGGDWLFINPQVITLQPGENRTIFLYANPPAMLNPDNYTLGIIAKSDRQLTGGYAKVQVSDELYSPPPGQLIPQNDAPTNQTNVTGAPTGYATLGRKNIARTLAIIGILITVLLIFLISWKAKKEESAPPPEAETEKAETGDAEQTEKSGTTA